MSTPNDLQALLASIRPRPSPSGTPAQDAPPHSQYPVHYQSGLRPQQPQQPPYDGQSMPHPQLLQHGYRHPSVSSVVHSPSPVNTPPHHGSDILSPNITTPRGEMFPQQHQPQPQNPDRAVNLLNLLKFNQGPAGGPIQQQPSPLGFEQPRSPQIQEIGPDGVPRSHARNISASDLVASLFGRQGQPLSSPAPPPGIPTPSQFAQPGPAGPGESASSAAPTAENTQEMLLRLLNRQTPTQDASQGPVRAVPQSAVSASAVKSPAAEPVSSSDIAEGPVEVPGVGPEGLVSGSPEVLAFQQPKSSLTPKEGIFTYTNPFDQLAAASPRKGTSQVKSRSASPAVELPKSQKINITAKVEAAPASQPSGSQPAARPESPELDEEQREAVNKVVGKLVDQIVGRDVSELVSRAIEETSPVAADEPESTQVVLSTIASHLRETATEAKEAAADEAAAPSAEKEVGNNENGDALADSWESAEDSAEKEEERVVPVHNFPLKPFISISLKEKAQKLPILRDDGIMDIARLKKEFDQLDRSLTSATSDYIVYALAKNGGMRIIRQDDGSDKQVFRSTRDRVFNVTLCTSATTSGSSEEQALLGIGVSGSVYWALISRAEQDLFELDALESESLIFPPFPASDENTSGGQLKTRAKRSSRHPGFFAIGRGKNIYVVSPQAAASPAYGVSGSQRTVNTEKFFKERALKISTGKAGKDFMFSDDDTVIASLDKTGRLRFWDIREVVNNPDFFINGPSPAEVRVPLNTFVTGSPSEKSWPTSILFIDKLRPYVKSMALRYVLVGLKQNHTLQLWDIGLGKAVQELKFPHENESDAICSVAYHPASGIIVVGHPTRNSIYFVHLSAPRYNLQPMSQASFIKRSGEKDSSLPKPESTACMSGIREISFASKGQLRSLDLLPISKAPGDTKDENGLFELYVMHSRGVTCLNIKKEDLGWSADNKIIRPVNALQEGLIEISELQVFPSYVTDEPSINGDSTSVSTKVTPREVVKKTSELIPEAAVPTPAAPRTMSPTKPVLKKKPVDEQAEPAVAPNGADKPEKKRKKKAAVTAAAVSETPAKAKEVSTAPFTTGEGQSAEVAAGTQPFAHPTENVAQTMQAATVDASQAPTTVVSDPGEIWAKHLTALQTGVTTEFDKSLGRELENLYHRFDEERRNLDAASAAKQDQVLRLVSSTLSDNVEKNLARIVSSSIQADVVPALTELTSKAVGKQLDEVLAQQLATVVPREVRQALPEAVARAVKQPEVTKVISDSIGQRLASHVENEMSRALHTTLTPAFRNLSLQAAEQIGSDMQKQVQAQMKQYEIQRHNDAAKIDQLTALVRGLSDTVASMAAAQNSFQEEILRFNRALTNNQRAEQIGSSQQAPPAGLPARLPAGPEGRSPEAMELAEIAQLMHAGRYEEGSVKWLQSSQQADLFDNLFVRLSPTYLASLSPIVALSVGVAVTSSLQTNIEERLTWLEVVLQTVDMRDADIREVAPRIIDILNQRLDSFYMSVAPTTPHEPYMRKLGPIARRLRELRG
ncbi:uncharacterized protein ACLA_027490 [Aspergillus clavatus NRRL 1]|uniref:EDC4-like protein pdc1 beta-propeller domain-containing protein n=1 Tax=Aspergillus clavatus (strain ATCC 1007 / CBS 513.65 / DSM 816 / NCTC 3887 / NRRL 1 / QM 1276 / 107) TaxID=344612 RepID=A1CQV6_ASPCL|nr:uncharacterized protein ACLA_027490 [Aspergillus clavatus NRRL 1]EAW08027.1 conserved hypothetical protein [Aspergillus clavatus NRRL 1]